MFLMKLVYIGIFGGVGTALIAVVFEKPDVARAGLAVFLVSLIVGVCYLCYKAVTDA